MPKKVDPRKYNLTTNKIRGSWWFLLIEADGEESLAHFSTITSIADVIRKGKGNPDTHVAKFGSKVLDNNKCLEDYKINTNGSKILNDYDWDGKYCVFFLQTDLKKDNCLSFKSAQRISSLRL